MFKKKNVQKHFKTCCNTNAIQYAALKQKKNLCLNWVPQLPQSWAVRTEIVWDSEQKGEMWCAACDHWTRRGDSTADCSPAVEWTQRNHYSLLEHQSAVRTALSIDKSTFPAVKQFYCVKKNNLIFKSHTLDHVCRACTVCMCLTELWKKNTHQCTHVLACARVCVSVRRERWIEKQLSKQHDFTMGVSFASSGGTCPTRCASQPDGLTE